jgi:hypothetical protein
MRDCGDAIEYEVVLTWREVFRALLMNRALRIPGNRVLLLSKGDW